VELIVNLWKLRFKVNKIKIVIKNRIYSKYLQENKIKRIVRIKKIAVKIMSIVIRI